MSTAPSRRPPALHPEGTRERILRLIAERGPVRAVEIADEFDITSTAVRRHLASLEESGAIVGQEAPESAPRGRGRPARSYVIGVAGHDQMPSAYEDIAVEALRYLASRLGADAVEAFAHERAEQLVDRFTPVVEAAGPDPMDRAAALAEALTQDGFAATARSVGFSGAAASDGLQLCQGHCPVRSVASEHRSLCEAEAGAFARLLGVHVQRLSTLAGGGHVCTTFVPAPTVRRQHGAPSGSADPRDTHARPARFAPTHDERTAR